MEMGQAGMRPCGQVRQKAVKNNTGGSGRSEKGFLISNGEMVKSRLE